MSPTLTHVRRILDDCALPYACLDLAGGHTLVVIERGGHALGPFDRDGRSALWLNPEPWESAGAMRRFVGDGQWNIGGERFWLAPEIRFTIRDRNDYWGSYDLPASMAPGDYRLRATGRAIGLAADATLPYHNPPDGIALVRIERSYRALPSPLRHLRNVAALTQDVSYAGFVHRSTLTLLPLSTGNATVEAWTLAQLVPDGTLIVPCAAGIEYEDYYEPIDDAYFRRVDGAVHFAVTGRHRYKVGLRSPHLTGRVGFLKPLPDGQALLIVRNFFNDPSSDYVEEPAERIGCRGLSVHVYNDGGMFGGFGELECNGRTIGGEDGNTGSDVFGFWQFQGPQERIGAIAEILLGSGARACAGLIPDQESRAKGDRITACTV